MDNKYFPYDYNEKDGHMEAGFLLSGFFEKNKTGVGGTYTELNSGRNSIIVEPLRVLAYEKMLSSGTVDVNYYTDSNNNSQDGPFPATNWENFIKTMQNRTTKKVHKVFYCGGDYGNAKTFTEEDVAAYLQCEEISYKKFIVVADSLPRLIEILKKQLGTVKDANGNDCLKENGEPRYRVFEEYFIAYDEIDSYQSDAAFRPAMATAFDYYWEFKKSSYEPYMEVFDTLDLGDGFIVKEWVSVDDGKRCMLSATARQDNFSDPGIRAEYKQVLQTGYQSSPATESEVRTSTQRTDERAGNGEMGKINLYRTNDPITKAYKMIKEFWENQKTEDKHEKLVVALNKTDYIADIIGVLPPEIRTECSLLCSVNSKNKAEMIDEITGEPINTEDTTNKRKWKFTFYRELEDCKLPSRITFMTCSYYVGIDINEPFHLIGVAYTNCGYTLLSPAKLIQIKGRCRVKDGVLSNRLIYNLYDDSANGHRDSLGRIVNEDEIPKAGESIDEYEKRLREIVLGTDRGAAFYLNLTKSMKDAAKGKGYRLLFNHFINNNLFELARCSAVSFGGSDEIPIVRVNKDGKLVPAYFNIDNIVNQAVMKNFLYSKSQPQSLPEALEESGYQTIECKEDIIEKSESIVGNLSKNVNEALFEREKDLIIQLWTAEDSAERDVAKMQLEQSGMIWKDGAVSGMTTNGQTLYYALGEVVNYIPLDELRKKVTSPEFLKVRPRNRHNNNAEDNDGSEESTENAVEERYGSIKSNLTKFVRATWFWAARDDDPVKHAIHQAFPTGGVFTNGEIKEKMKGICRNVIRMANNKINSFSSAANAKTVFVECRHTNTSRSEGQRRSANRITGYDTKWTNVLPESAAVSDFTIDFTGPTQPLEKDFSEKLKKGISPNNGTKRYFCL